MARVTTVEALQEMNNDVLAWVVSTLEISQSLVDFCQDCKVQEVILTNRIYICASLRLSNSLRDEFLRRIEKFILLKFFYRTRKMDVVEISVALEILSRVARRSFSRGSVTSFTFHLLKFSAFLCRRLCLHNFYENE